MREKSIKVPVNVPINFNKHLFSEVKIYIPKKLVKNILVPCVDKGCDWYVYYYYRNPYTDKMQKFMEKRGINSYKTLAKRKKAANNLRKALTRFLQLGNSPFEAKPSTEIEKESFTILESLQLAYDEKRKIWSESTKNSYKSLFDVIKNYIEESSLSKRDINELSKRHISLFLNGLTVTPVTRNNYRRFFVSLIEQLITDGILTHNFASSIPKLKEKPTKNKPFTKDQLIAIKNYLNENDPYLFMYIQFLMYAFLRPIEVNRIKIKDININQKIINLSTKTEVYATVLIIDKLQEVLNCMNIDFSKKEYTLFTKFEKPFFWETSIEKSKADFFSHRFKKVKEALQLGDEYGLYSFRHTSTLDLYHTSLRQGLSQLEAKHKLMTITRHKSMAGLDAYLRDIGAELPKDYSGDYSFDF